MEDCEISDDLVATAARDHRYGVGTQLHYWQWQSRGGTGRRNLFSW